MSHEILGRASGQHSTVPGPPHARTRDTSFLERQRAEDNIHTHAVSRLREQDSIAQCEFARISPARIQLLEKRVDESLLVAKPSQECKINILSESRSAPALNRHAADE